LPGVVVIPRSDGRSRRFTVIQQGQVFKLKAKGVDGEPLWAYRYRLAGRGSARLQAGGFASRAEAQRALQNKLARLRPGERGVRITLGEWVEEHLETHPGERVTIAKLRWLLGKATATLGDVRLADLSPEAICAWRLTVPEGRTRHDKRRVLRIDVGALSRISVFENRYEPLQRRRDRRHLVGPRRIRGSRHRDRS
jgi:hypothetical protein